MNHKLISSVAAGLVLVLVACGGPEERKSKYRLRAQEYIQEGNFPKARVALRNVLKIDPKDAEAYFLYAQVEEKERNWRNAFANYQRVVELAPEHDRALIRLGKFYLEARMTDKALEMATAVLTKQPDHVQGQALKIAVSAVTGHLPEATSEAEVLVAGHPGDPETVLLLATLYAAQEQLDKSESILRQAVVDHPENLDVLDGLASILAKRGNVPAAEETYRKIVALEPRVYDHRVRLAKFYDDHKAYGKAEAVLREAIQLEPDNDLRRLTLAEYLLLHGQPDQVEAVLVEAQRAMPHSVKIQFALGKVYEERGKIEQARSVYEAVRNEYKKEPSGLDALVKLAALDWSAGKEVEAERKLQEVLRENPRSAEGLLLQGKIALARNQGKEAIQAFRSVLRDQPDLVEGHLLLGQAHGMVGEIDLARESFDRAIALDPARTQAHVYLATLDVSTGRAKEAKQRLELVLAREPNNVQALGMLFRLQLEERDWANTEQTLKRLRAAGANQAVADLSEGALYQAQQQWEAASAAFERAHKAVPNAPEPLVALVQLDSRRGNVGKAQARLEEILAKDSRHPYGHGLLGELLMVKGDTAAAESHFVIATQVNATWTMPWIHLATLKLRSKKTDEGVTWLRQGIQANPESGELRLLLATTLTEQGQVDQAISEYEAILKKTPDAVLAANNLAALLADRKSDRQSLDRAFALTRNFERVAPNPVFLDTLGWVQFKLGHNDEAIRIMQQALAKAPDHPVLNYHLGVIYAKAGRTGDAKPLLEKAVKAGRPFGGLEEAKTTLAELQG